MSATVADEVFATSETVADTWDPVWNYIGDYWRPSATQSQEKNPVCFLRHRQSLPTICDLWELSIANSIGDDRQRSATYDALIDDRRQHIRTRLYFKVYFLTITVFIAKNLSYFKCRAKTHWCQNLCNDTIKNRSACVTIYQTRK